MLKKSLLAAVPVAGLSGCVVVPSLSSDSAVRSDEIIEHVQCELQSAYRNLNSKYPRVLPNLAATYRLTFTAAGTNAGGLSAGEWDFPGVWSLGAGATLANTGSHQGSVKYKVAPLTIDQFDCSNERSFEASVAQPGFRGSLGIQSWLDEALQSGLEQSQMPEELSYTVSFTAKYDASLKPKYSIANLTATPFAQRTRTNTDTLDLGFVLAASPQTKGLTIERTIPADVDRRLDQILDNLERSRE